VNVQFNHGARLDQEVNLVKPTTPYSTAISNAGSTNSSSSKAARGGGLRPGLIRRMDHQKPRDGSHFRIP